MTSLKEKYIYIAFIALMVATSSGLPYLRLAVYVIPFLAVMLWLSSGKPVFNFNIIVAPFVLLLVLSLLSLVPWDYNTFKKGYFILVFTTVFVLFDFSKADIDFRKLGLFFVVMAIFSMYASGRGMRAVEYDVMDSKSAFESTFAFPIGIIALYFIIIRKYLLGVLFLACSILFLKRIVLVAIIFSVVIWFLPEKIRKYILNPWSVTFVTLTITILSIYFANGYFDQIILDTTGKAANDLAKGRESLWAAALESIDFTYKSFLLWGVGIGKVVTHLQQDFNMDRILLHNDLLSLLLEIGFVFFIAFIFLLNAVKTASQRVIALFITILFSTDNVIIYQHLMFVYLLIQQDLLKYQPTDEKVDNQVVDNMAYLSDTRILKKRRSSGDIIIKKS